MVIGISIAVVGVFLLLFFLGKMSPFEMDITADSFVTTDNKVEVIKYVEIEKPVEIIKEIEKIVEKEVPVEVIKEVEKIVEVEKEVIKEVIVEKQVEDNIRINELLQRVKFLEQNESIISTVWRNIGLELYNSTTDKDFIGLLNDMKDKKVLIVTDSSYVLGSHFKDHKIYEGTFKRWEILDDRYPDQPAIRMYISVPALTNTTVMLQWVFDKHKFDKDFSSPKLVADFLKTKEPVNELLLIEH